MSNLRAVFPLLCNSSHPVICVGEACFGFAPKGCCNPNQPTCHLFPSCITRARWHDQREAEKRDLRRCNSEKSADQIKQYVIVFFLVVIADLFYLEVSESWRESGASLRVPVTWREQPTSRVAGRLLPPLALGRAIPLAPCPASCPSGLTFRLWSISEGNGGEEEGGESSK